MLVPVEVVDYRLSQTKIEISVNRYYQDDVYKEGSGYLLSLNGYILSYKYIGPFIKRIESEYEIDKENPYNRFSAYIDNIGESSSILEKYKGYFDSVYERFYEAELISLSLATKFKTKTRVVTHPVTLSGYFMVKKSTSQIFIGCHYKREKVHDQSYYYITVKDLYNRTDGETIKKIIIQSSGVADFDFPVDENWEYKRTHKSASTMDELKKMLEQINGE